MEDGLKRIGLSGPQILRLKDEEFEMMEDVLALNDNDLSQIGFVKMGTRKAILRKFAAESERKKQAVGRGGDDDVGNNTDGYYAR